MVIIAEANMLLNLEDSDKKALSTLTGSDKIIVLSDKKSTVSVETMQLFLGLKAKSEFVQVEDLKAQFSLGFKYGEFSSKFAKDKVKILTNNDYSAVLPTNMICVKSLSGAKKTTTVKKTTSTKEVNKKETPVKKAVTKSAPVKKVVEVVEEKVAPKRRGKLKDLSAESVLAAYPALAPYKAKITSLSGMFAQAIKNSTDADASLKMQLKMTFADDSEAIWKIIKKDYAKLKALAE